MNKPLSEMTKEELILSITEIPAQAQRRMADLEREYQNRLLNVNQHFTDKIAEIYLAARTAQKELQDEMDKRGMLYDEQLRPKHTGDNPDAQRNPEDNDSSG